MFNSVFQEDDDCECGHAVKEGLCGGCGQIPEECECTCGYCGFIMAECQCDKIANEAEPQQ